MSIKKSAKPALRVKTTTSSLASSPTLSHQSSYNAKVESTSEVFEEKSDEEMTDFVASRPLSVTIPRASGFHSTGPYCPRRPNLADILANNSPQPWTLSAFMAYLSQNHCLETLEFTMDASRYRKHYSKMSSRSPSGQLLPGTTEGDYVLALWQKLLEAYIIPNGPREVNIPADVRDSLIILATSEIPPDPSVLDVAVQKVYELMDESVLVPFLNSVYPQTALPDSTNNSQEDLPYHVRSHEDRSLYRRSTRKERRSSPSMPSSIPSSAPAVQNRASAPSSLSHFARTLSHSTRHASSSSKISVPSTRSSSTAVMSPWSPAHSEGMVLSPLEVGLTDDSSVSPPGAFIEPMTPPTTPPQCDFGSPTSSNGYAGSRSSGGTWKKMRSSFTFKKKSGSLREEDTDQNGSYL